MLSCARCCYAEPHLLMFCKHIQHALSLSIALLFPPHLHSVRTEYWPALSMISNGRLVLPPLKYTYYSLILRPHTPGLGMRLAITTKLRTQCTHLLLINTLRTYFDWEVEGKPTDHTTGMSSRNCACKDHVMDSHVVLIKA